MMLPMSRRCVRLWLRAGVVVLFAFYVLMALISNYSQNMETSNRPHRTETRSDLLKKLIKKNKEFDFQRRHERMAAVCNQTAMGPLKWQLEEDLFLDNLIWDSRNNWLYCSVLKAGSTFWKRVLSVTSGKSANSGDPLKISPLKDHSKYLDTLNKQQAVDIDNILTSSHTFIFGRDPYSRLFSCYIDKIFTPRPFYNPLREAIMLFTRPIPFEKLVKKSCALDITFAEFFKFVVFSVATNVNADQHFLPMYQVCRPCEIQYEYIGKMETFSEDTSYVLGKMGANNLSDFTREQLEMDSLLDMVQSVFFERNESVPCLEFGKSLSIIWQKAIIRGILSKDQTMPERFLQSGNVTEENFMQSIVTAYRSSIDDTSRYNNQREALISAFKNVSSQDMDEYQFLFKPDFDIFGYDINPPWLSVRNISDQRVNFN